eukprot:m.231391 g.231391  ORF g.231391 m.231391 type:complete len:130 (-) comp12208_c0_seq1:376-765(-)
MAVKQRSHFSDGEARSIIDPSLVWTPSLADSDSDEDAPCRSSAVPSAALTKPEKLSPLDLLPPSKVVAPTWRSSLAASKPAQRSSLGGLRATNRCADYPDEDISANMQQAMVAALSPDRVSCPELFTSK